MLISALAIPGRPEHVRGAPGYEELLTLVTDAVREEITAGTIPPGTLLECHEIARRHGVSGTGDLVVSALARLREEGIVYLERNHRYAAPAGPPDRAASARLGAELRLRREEAGLTWDQLAAASPVLPPCWATSAAHRSEEIRAA